MTTPTNAVAYLRVSGLSQTLGDGFPRQQEAVDTLAKNQGFKIVQTFQENISGTKPWHERPVFLAMMQIVGRNSEVNTIVVENLTRLAREFAVQQAILMAFASRGINLISADTGENITEAIKSDPVKVALIQMQGIFSELEKTIAVNRLKKARERKKAETGRCEGQLPYGTKPGEQDTLHRMVEMREVGMPIRAIVEDLNEEAPTTRNGRPWTVGVVARILARHLNPEFS